MCSILHSLNSPKSTRFIVKGFGQIGLIFKPRTAELFGGQILFNLQRGRQITPRSNLMGVNPSSHEQLYQTPEFSMTNLDTKNSEAYNVRFLKPL